jgi:hypothetical protein
VSRFWPERPRDIAASESPLNFLLRMPRRATTLDFQKSRQRRSLHIGRMVKVVSLKNESKRRKRDRDSNTEL